ncbi:plasmid replication protein RepC [Pseudaestuariivita sp.]|uniref:plasmid replication protein RepC n=1 Tax=Pseudaestuariivita sp. TaxID=2211669 RepID=UPI0040585BF3
MRRITTTSFGARPISAALKAHITRAEAPAPCTSVDKWALFQQLCAAREAFSVSHRSLAVLNALLTFHPRSDLRDGDRLIVFPSNQTLSTRLQGMPASTLRRHIAALVAVGLICRHDSPNGKRYACRGGGPVFGFDLRPLLVRADEIAKAADAAEQVASRIHALRVTFLSLRRDLIVAGHETHACLVALSRILRRKVTVNAWEDALDALAQLRTTLLGGPLKTSQLSATDTQNERHQSNSKKEKEDTTRSVDIVTHCPNALQFAEAPPRQWSDLHALSQRLLPMIGVAFSAWERARRVMGDQATTVTILAITERIAQIANPPAYLNRLIAQAERGQYDPNRLLRLAGQGS